MSPSSSRVRGKRLRAIDSMRRYGRDDSSSRRARIASMTAYQLRKGLPFGTQSQKSKRPSGLRGAGGSDSNALLTSAGIETATPLFKPTSSPCQSGRKGRHTVGKIPRRERSAALDSSQ